MLLVAAANVANLALARAQKRERELAVRAALGAGRGRLARQLLTESAILAAAGGVVGLGIALLGVDLLVDFARRFTPRAEWVSIDTNVLIFTGIVSVVTGILFGLAPVFRAVPHFQTAFKEAGGWQTARRSKLRVQFLSKSRSRSLPRWIRSES